MIDKVEAAEKEENLQEAVENNTEENTVTEEAVEVDAEVQEKDAETEKEISPEVLIAELQNKVLRTRADFDNFRKRTQKDLADTRAYAKMSTIEEILPVVDTFKMAMQAVNADNADLNTLVAGLNMIQSQFDQVFSGLGITEIDAVGKEFDHNVHEAVSHEFSEDIEEHTVIRQLRCGFKMGERLLRAATVVVSKGVETEESIEAENAVDTTEE